MPRTGEPAAIHIAPGPLLYRLVVVNEHGDQFFMAEAASPFMAPSIGGQVDWDTGENWKLKRVSVHMTPGSGIQTMKLVVEL
jgi:hypothetical protein